MLIIDDDRAIRSALGRWLQSRGMVVETVADGAAGIEVLSQPSSRIDVALVDVRMPGMTGLEFLQRVREMGIDIETVLMTGYATVTEAVTAVRSGAYGFLTKPFASNDIVALELRKAAERRRLRTTAARIESELAAQPTTEKMLFRSATMRELYRRIEGIAGTQSTILVRGESGTGKELVARAIHRRSDRNGKPLVTINCGAIPSELVESELFGHVRGAFTTAHAARAGAFESAHTGTLFLDEIGELPTSVQAKLLRALQFGEIKPVGSDSVKIVDARIIAATNVDLQQAIARGTFRQDLYYRINMCELELPPLRSRGDDVFLLAQHFIHEQAKRLNRPELSLSEEVLAILRRYPWPGNVRELEHAIAYAAMVTPSERVEVRALPATVRAFFEDPLPKWDEPVSSQRLRVTSPSLSSSPVSSGPPDSTKGPALDPTVWSTMTYADAKKAAVAAFTDAYVRAVLQMSNGNVSEAARRAGLDRANFRRLVRTTSTAGGDDSAPAPASVRNDED